MRKSSLCTTRLPHLELCVGSLHCFPPSSSKSTPRNSAWSNATASSRFPLSSGHLVFGFAAGESRTLAGFRRSYNSTADESISPGGFYQRLTPTLAEYLRDLVEHGLDEVAVPDAVDADINRFRDVIIADGTVLRLHEFLSEKYEARHEGSRLERSSTCSTMLLTKRLNGSMLPTRKHTIARCSRQGRGLRTASCCST